MKFPQHLFLGMALACLLLSGCQTTESPITPPQAQNFVVAPAPVPIIDEAALINLARTTNTDPHVLLDSALTGEALEAHLAWAASLPADSVLAIGAPDTISNPPMSGDTTFEGDLGSALGVRLVVNRPHCRYFIIGLQGIDCDGFGNPNGGLLCVQCDTRFPQGTCPSWQGQQMNYYDANGNVTCTGKVFMDLGQACDVCPMPAKIVSKR
jgi:hypothetical protein